MKRACGLLVVAACAGLVAGCAPPAGSISGTVQYKGKPVPGGRIAFLAADGRLHPADIGEDGSYTVADVPVGPAKVSVDNQMLRMGQQAGVEKLLAGANAPRGQAPTPEMPKLVGRYVPLPATAADPEQSGIVYQVQTGRQTFPVDLK
jgi:hypothetical protein